MTKKYNNNKGFLIIQIELLDALVCCNIGCRCDNCNNNIDVFEKDGFEDIYYIAAINRAVCKRCCDDFINGYDRHPEDIPFEVRHYNFYAEKLNLEKVCI